MTGLEVSVCWVSGEPLKAVSAERAWTVAQVKAAIQDVVPPGTGIRLVARNRLLEEDRTLEDCGLGPSAVLHAVVDLRPLEKALIKIMLEQRSLTDAEVCHLVARADSAEVNMKEQDLTALHHAADRGMAGACRALLNHHLFTEANGKDGVGFTALHWAALAGSVETCRSLLDHEQFLEASARSSGGQTALHLAARRCHHEVCSLFVEHPRFTAIGTKDNRGRTALDFAQGPTRDLLEEELG